MKDTCKILAQNCGDIISEYCMYMLTKLRVISFVKEQEITNTLQSKKNIQLYTTVLEENGRYTWS